jgi:serine protease Do
MKRYKYLLLCLTIVVSIVSLGGCLVPPSTLSGIQTPAPSSTPAMPQIGALVTLPSFADLTDTVKHSVVAIDTETVVTRRYIQRTIQGAGSGWIIDESGIIVTNNHVIEGAQTITVELENGKTYTPVSIKTDPDSDIAILKINAGKLPALKVGDASKLRVGDWVVAAGNALGMGISVKDGIVSRLGVSIQISPSETYSNLIETNAAINPGNSGGPLVNLAGEVIGITSLKLAIGGVEGMGYAINIEDALPVIQRLFKSI